MQQGTWGGNICGAAPKPRREKTRRPAGLSKAVLAHREAGGTSKPNKNSITDSKRKRAWHFGDKGRRQQDLKAKVNLKLPTSRFTKT
jgi:hypothetical protein